MFVPNSAFWKRFKVGKDDILTDIVTGERFGYFIDPKTEQVGLIPESTHIENMNLLEKIIAKSSHQHSATQE